MGGWGFGTFLAYLSGLFVDGDLGLRSLAAAGGPMAIPFHGYDGA
jgi:hypothetical protein